MSNAREREISVRASDVLLDHVYNPAKSADIGRATAGQLSEACGLVPDFFCNACIEAHPLTLDNIAAGMDAAYGSGGFSIPMGGTVRAWGTYTSPDDPDLPPLARFVFDNMLGLVGFGFELFVYEYGIAAVRDRATSATKVGRFS